MSRRVVTAILSCLILHAETKGQMHAPVASQLCSEVIIFDSHPLSTLAVSVRRKIREAVKFDVLAILHDPGMGLEMKWQDVKLDAVQISHDMKGDSLYAVHWGIPQFGVNGAVWIVELEANQVRNIGPRTGTRSSGWSLSGWGMQVLSTSDKRYPDLMFASKGFRGGGGSEAEAVCAQKAGSTYTSVACPAGCFDQLNSR
jgi:hypothetical protein